MWSEYLFAGSVEGALELLGRYAGDARLIAGGTDLVIRCQRHECPARILVDISRIPGLDRIEETGGWVVIGANVTHAQAASSPLLREKGALLAEACGVIGGPQVRNMGTLVGNLVTELPAADAALALLVLDGEVEVALPSGRRRMPVTDLYEGAGRCRIDARREMITHLRFRPLGSEYRWAHERLAQRKVHALPILNVAAVGALRGDRLADVRIAVGPVAERPLRIRDCGRFLEGRPATPEALREAAEMAAAHCSCDSPLRGPDEYRHRLAAVLVRRALERISRQNDG